MKKSYSAEDRTVLEVIGKELKYQKNRLATQELIVVVCPYPK